MFFQSFLQSFYSQKFFFFVFSSRDFYAMITESASDRNEVSFMNIRHKRKEKEEAVSTARELFQWVAAIVAAVLIALAIDNFVIVNAQIPSGSMENTIMTGDRVIGNRFAYSFSDPQRFDIIIFRYPDDESQLFIKRIIGLPGETVEIRDGKIYLNGSDEPLEDVQTKETMVGSFGPYTVPENSYFVMGDNRNNSSDSRTDMVGNITRENIIGKAWLRIWPVSDFGVLQHQ